MGFSVVRPSCSRVGLAPDCPTHARSKRHHRCAFGKPNCTWLSGCRRAAIAGALAPKQRHTTLKPRRWCTTCNQPRPIQMDVLGFQIWLCAECLRITPKKTPVSWKNPSWASSGNFFLFFSKIGHMKSGRSDKGLRSLASSPSQNDHR